METKHYAVAIHLDRYKNGKFYLARDITSDVTTTKDKQSADSGEFVPNVYQVNPYLIFDATVDIPRLTWIREYRICAPYVGCNDWKSVYSGHLGYGLLTPQKLAAKPQTVPFFSNIDSRALLKAQAKIEKAVIDAGVELGEVAETIRMLRRPFSSVRDFLFQNDHKRMGLLNKLIRYSKTGKWSGQSGVSAADTAASTWLEIRYGLLPLFKTIQQIIELAHTGMKPFVMGQIRSTRARLKDEYHTSYMDNYAFLYANLTALMEVYHETSCNASVQYKVVGVPATKEQLGLAPQFVPEIAWELTKLSFVMDWWFDVGTWLQAMRIKPHVKILGNTVGYRADTLVSAYGVGFSEPGISGAPSGTMPNTPLGTYKKKYYKRDVNVEWPSLPQFTEVNPLDLFRALDSVSLIWQSITSEIRLGSRR